MVMGRRPKSGLRQPGDPPWDKLLWTPYDMAEAFGTSVMHISTLERLGTIPPPILIAGARRWLPGDVRIHLETQVPRASIHERRQKAKALGITLKEGTDEQ